MRAGLLFIIVMLGFLIGCASVDPQPRWQEVEAIAGERTEGKIVWEQSPADAQKIQTKVDELLADGLTRDEAVRITLLNNRRLQAAFENIGAAEADLVQAGLLSNPSFDAFIAFPISAGNTGGSLLGYLSDIWTIPARKAVYAKRAEAAIHQVGALAIAKSTEAAMAYDDVLYHIAALDLEKQILKVLEDTAKRMQIRFNRGLADDLDVKEAKVNMFDQRVTADNAVKELKKAKTRLNVALSLSADQTNYTVTDSLDSLPDSQWTVDSATTFARDHRLDLIVARLNVERAEKMAAFERTQVFQSVGLGPAYEGDFDVENTYGPAFSLQLPIFDQNQAQIAKADFRLRQAQKSLTAMELSALKEVSDTVEKLKFLGAEIFIMKQDVMPSLDRKVQYAEKWGFAHQLNLLHLLEARRELLLNRRMLMQAFRNYRQTEVMLHQTLWGGTMI